MCTNYVLVKKNGSAQLAERLSVNPSDLIYGTNFKPGSTISIVAGDEAGHVVLPAIWWLYLQQTDDGLWPHRDYFSVNTRYDKLNKKPEYRYTRCIIPATGFVESQDGKAPHLLEPADGSALAFGGLYKEWVDQVTGEVVYSASIITLAGIEPLKDIHRKSVPLWLPEEAYEKWLSPTATDTAEMDYLLEPSLRCDLKATPIDRTFSKVPTGEAFLIPRQF